MTSRRSLIGKDVPTLIAKEASMLVHDEIPPQPGFLAAQHIVEGAVRLFNERLAVLRIPDNHIIVRSVRVGRLGEQTCLQTNACALHVVLRNPKRRWVSDMRPTSLWLIAGYEDWIVVLASGSNAWEFKRVELAHALERMKEELNKV